MAIRINYSLRMHLSILIIKDILFVLLLCEVLCCGSASAQPVSSIQPTENSFLFFYNRRYTILFKDYKCNRIRIGKMVKLLRIHKQEIQDGKSYLDIRCYVLPQDLKDPRKLNKASIQASVARACFKKWFHINHKHCTFAFDTTGSVCDRVGVRYVPIPVPSQSNKLISYTFKKDIGSINQSVASYKVLPLGNKPNGQSLQEINRASVDSLSRQDSVKSLLAVKELSQKDSMILPRDTVLSKKAVLQDSIGITAPATPVLEQSSAHRRRLFIAVKTNLLYWAGLIPDFKRWKSVPNIEAEWYIRPHWSVNVDGSLIYLHNLNYTQGQWGVSYIGLEPRYWLSDGENYTGFYGGLYGLTGNFDLKENIISKKGHTGDLHEGGVSLGYYLPLSERWGLEAGIRVGYRKESGDVYYYDQPHFYYDSTYGQHGLKLTGIRLLLTYRLWKSTIEKKQ